MAGGNRGYGCGTLVLLALAAFAVWSLVLDASMLDLIKELIR